MTILVVGARGSIGGAVLDGLLESDATVRASSRDPAAGGVPDGVQVVRGDLTDPSTFPTMLEGVEKAFVYAEPDRIDDFLGAAKDAGTEHIVLLSSNSVVFPNAEQNPIALRHIRVERAIEAAGIDHTFVRPGYLATNTLRRAAVIRAERTVRTAFPDGGVPLVHERDVGDVAARALLDDEHRGRAYLVLGGAWLSEREQVATIAEAIGQPIELRVVDVDEYRRVLAAELPPTLVDALIRVRGHVPQVPEELRHDAVRDVLGRDPLPFSTWAADHADDFR